MKAYLIILKVRRIFIYLCLILSFLFLTFPAFSQNDESPDFLFPVKDTIQIAVEPDYPPHSFINENGEADGFAVELFKEAANAVGLKVKIKIGIWNVIKQELAEGQIDALPFVGRTPERESLYDFTVPYLSLHGAVFVRKGMNDIQSIEDLKDKEIVVMKGDNSEEFVRRENLSDKIFTTNTFEEAFQQLANGEYDAVVTQRITGIDLLQEMGIKSIIPLDFQIPDFRQDFCFAVKKGNQQLLNRLNEGLSIIIANDTCQEIRDKWLGPPVEEKLSTADIFKIILYIFIPLIIILSLLWVFFLRREVKRKTVKLNREIRAHKKILEEFKVQQEMLRETEQQIRLLLNSTAEGIYGVDNSGLCTLINASALEILGFSEQEVIGKNLHHLIHHRKVDGSELVMDECNIHKALKNGEGTSNDDELFWRKDGSGFPVEYFSYPIVHEDKIVGAVVTFWNITERKKAEGELHQIKDELEIQIQERTAELEDKVHKLNRSQKAMLYMVEDLNRITSELKAERRKLEISNSEMDAFNYSVSHDLRAPLRAIRGYSGFLLEDYKDNLDDEGKRYLQVISQNAGKMDALISNMLNLSRVSRADLRLVNVDMKATARSMFMEIASQTEKDSFEFVVNGVPKVKCDIHLIKQVWQNLIGNALKYSSKSDIKKIEIGAEINKDEIFYFVKDWGAGFNSSYSHKLFGVFQRLHTDYEFEGTGVGLAIVQRIIQRHGGKVWAESVLNEGAIFWFSLPR